MFLDSCKKGKKWLGCEPFCWSNDEKLLSCVPSDGKECKMKDLRLKDEVDLVQAIRVWQSREIGENCFCGKNIFVWIPNGRSNTYSKILTAFGANVHSINTENGEFNDAEVMRQCKAIEAEIGEVYLGNQ